MIYDDPLITYDGLPTDAYLNQILTAVNATPSATVAALQGTTIPVDVQMMNSAEVIGTGSEDNPWRGVGVSV